MAAALQQPLAAAGPGAVIPLDMAPSQPAVAQALYQLEYDDFDHYCSLFCQQKGVCVCGEGGAWAEPACVWAEALLFVASTRCHTTTGTPCMR